MANSGILYWSTDWHLRSRHRIESREDGVRRLRDSLWWTLDSIRDTSPSVVVLGGDLVDDARRVDYESYGMLVEWMYEAVRLCPVVALVGNHDRYGPGVSDHALHPLPSLP